ncbi:hypothetical protein MHYP_G00317260 [Metynnis hypsauchen]
MRLPRKPDVNTPRSCSKVALFPALLAQEVHSHHTFPPKHILLLQPAKADFLLGWGRMDNEQSVQFPLVLDCSVSETSVYVEEQAINNGREKRNGNHCGEREQSPADLLKNVFAEHTNT